MDHSIKRRKYYDYFKGRGIDVGPFNLPFINNYNSKSIEKLEYVDFHTPEELKLLFPEIPNFNPIKADYIHDVSTNAFNFNSEKYNFIILSHVLEHLMNPFWIIEMAFDKLEKEGVLYLGVPDCRFSDDKGRPLTEFKELLNLYTKKISSISEEKVLDYLKSPIISQVPWIKNILENGLRFTKEQLKLVVDRSFHVHVWDSYTFMKQVLDFLYLKDLKFEIIDFDLYEYNGYENIIVLKKL
jgi:hypothetical protein